MSTYNLYTVSPSGFRSLVQTFYSLDEEDALAKAAIFVEEEGLFDVILEEEGTGYMWEYSDIWEPI